MGGSGVNWDAPLAAFAPLQVSLLADNCAAPSSNGWLCLYVHVQCCYMHTSKVIQLHAPSKGGINVFDGLPNQVH